MSETINFDGVSVNDLYDKILSKGITKSDASVLVSSWIFENVGRVRHPFNYQEPFPVVDVNCMPAPFVATFTHTDWVDGEDVVQAGETPGERGFNARFHEIEADITSLGTSVGQIFACMAEMRRSLHSLLDEIRAELNRINADVNETVSRPQVENKTPNYSGLLDFGKYQGTTKFLDKTVSVWQTDKGTLVLPALDSVGIDVVTGTKLNGAPQVGQLFVEHPEIKAQYPGVVDVADLVTRYGDERLGDGRTLKEVVNVLPATGQYASLDAVVDEVSEREAALVRTTLGADVAVNAALGLGAADGGIGNAAIGKLDTIPTNARLLLASNGITNVAALAGSTPEAITTILAKGGLPGGPGSSAAWTTYAKTLMRLQ